MTRKNSNQLLTILVIPDLVQNKLGQYPFGEFQLLMNFLEILKRNLTRSMKKQTDNLKGENFLRVKIFL